MSTGRRLPNHLLAYAVTGPLNFGLSLILGTKSEVRKDTCTNSLPANDERRPLLSGNTVDAHEADTKPYEQLSFLESLLPNLSKESQSLIFKLCLLFAIDSRSGELEPASRDLLRDYLGFGIEDPPIMPLAKLKKIRLSATKLRTVT